jgi:hypothetical protein
MEVAMIGFVRAAAVAAVIALSSLPAAAQGDGDDAWPGMMAGGPMMGDWGGGPDGPMLGRGRRMQAVIEARLDEVKKEIGITPAQEEVWKAYAESVQTRFSAMRQTRRGLRDAIEDGTAIDRMNARIAMMELQLESLKSTRTALEALYGALDGDQKEKADDLIGFHAMM